MVFTEVASAVFLVMGPGQSLPLNLSYYMFTFYSTSVYITFRIFFQVQFAFQALFLLNIIEFQDLHEAQYSFRIAKSSAKSSFLQPSSLQVQGRLGIYTDYHF